MDEELLGYGVAFPIMEHALYFYLRVYWGQDKVVVVVSWPALLLDLNPIENFRYVKMRLRRNSPSHTNHHHYGY